MSRGAARGKNEAFKVDEIRFDETLMIYFEKYGYCCRTKKSDTSKKNMI